MSNLKKFFFIFLFTFCLVFLFLLLTGKNKLSSNNIKDLIKRYIYTQNKISNLERKISDLNLRILKQNKFPNYEIIESLAGDFDKAELNFAQNLEDIRTFKESYDLGSGLKIDKYRLTAGFYSGIHNSFPGSGFMDIYKNNIFVLSARGILAYSDVNNIHSLKQVKHNINEFINFSQFEKGNWFSIKDMNIENDEIYISFTEEIKNNCWNTSVIFGKLNLDSINFTKLFSPEECIHSENSVDGEFNAHQSGGRIVNLGKNHILLSVGDYRSRFLAQDVKSINGKIIKIDIRNSDYDIISMGNRNPQGLLYDKENNFLLFTEHGPQGGDEINLLDLSYNKNQIFNYGWPKSSYGEHYGGKLSLENQIKYQKYPLHKSHKEYGFIEPLKFFVPSIGISEILKTGKKNYILSSLKEESIYFFQLDDENKIINFKKIKVYERIRDIEFYNNKIYLFLENTASISIINL